MAGVVCVAVILLMRVLGGQAVDLLRATSTSGNPPSTPEVNCWCASFPNLTLCSWPEPPESPPTHYIATYSEKNSQIKAQCQLFPPSSSFAALTSASSSKRAWHCYMPNLKLLTDYIINVTAVYPSASSSHLISFMLEDIVKPDPPVAVRVSPLNNGSLLVQWSPPASWAHLAVFPLKYQIMYKWDYRGTPMSVNLGPTESTKIELKGLAPGKQYQFQVCARELLGLGKCSDWSTPVDATIQRRRQ